MIAIVMSTEHLPLQDAVDFVGTMCKAAIDRFIENKALLPSFSHLDSVYPTLTLSGERREPGSIDEDVKKYVQGLQDWIVGSLHWSFETERYFGRMGHVAKRTRIVQLLPQRAANSGSSSGSRLDTTSGSAQALTTSSMTTRSQQQQERTTTTTTGTKSKVHTQRDASTKPKQKPKPQQAQLH